MYKTFYIESHFTKSKIWENSIYSVHFFKADFGHIIVMFDISMIRTLTLDVINNTRNFQKNWRKINAHKTFYIELNLAKSQIRENSINSVHLFKAYLDHWILIDWDFND